MRCHSGDANPRSISAAGVLPGRAEAIKMLRALIAACGLLLLQVNAGVADDAPPPAPAKPVTITEQQVTDAKAIFANQCGWCHGDYGMKPDKGPRLAGTQMSEPQVEQRIRNGKPGYMPSFRKFLSDDQIALMAHYVKSLEPPPE
jgi:mono/diheme cytochrome c family protein